VKEEVGDRTVGQNEGSEEVVEEVGMKPPPPPSSRIANPK
jgi:hypothetical protein